MECNIINEGLYYFSLFFPKSFGHVNTPSLKHCNSVDLNSCTLNYCTHYCLTNRIAWQEPNGVRPLWLPSENKIVMSIESRDTLAKTLKSKDYSSLMTLRCCLFGKWSSPLKKIAKAFLYVAFMTVQWPTNVSHTSKHLWLPTH